MVSNVRKKGEIDYKHHYNHPINKHFINITNLINYKKININENVLLLFDDYGKIIIILTIINMMKIVIHLYHNINNNQIIMQIIIIQINNHNKYDVKYISIKTCRKI